LPSHSSGQAKTGPRAFPLSAPRRDRAARCRRLRPILPSGNQRNSILKRRLDLPSPPRAAGPRG
jgi:hypothetical protein